MITKKKLTMLGVALTLGIASGSLGAAAKSDIDYRIFAQPNTNKGYTSAWTGGYFPSKAEGLGIPLQNVTAPAAPSTFFMSPEAHKEGMAVARRYKEEQEKLKHAQSVSIGQPLQVSAQERGVDAVRPDQPRVGSVQERERIAAEEQALLQDLSKEKTQQATQPLPYSRRAGFSPLLMLLASPQATAHSSAAVQPPVAGFDPSDSKRASAREADRYAPSLVSAHPVVPVSVEEVVPTPRVLGSAPTGPLPSESGSGERKHHAAVASQPVAHLPEAAVSAILSAPSAAVAQPPVQEAGKAKDSRTVALTRARRVATIHYLSRYQGVALVLPRKEKEGRATRFNTTPAVIIHDYFDKTRVPASVQPQGSAEIKRLAASAVTPISHSAAADRESKGEAAAQSESVISAQDTLRKGCERFTTLDLF